MYNHIEIAFGDVFFADNMVVGGRDDRLACRVTVPNRRKIDLSPFRLLFAQSWLLEQSSIILFGVFFARIVVVRQILMNP